MNGARYTVVAFHTEEYADCVEPFCAAVESLGLPTFVQPMHSRGEWALNTALKPLALLRVRDAVRGPLLYLDIDTRLVRAPVLPIGAWDIATAENPVKAHKNRVNAAALFIADTEGAREFLQAWWSDAAARSCRDHPALTRALEQSRDWLIATDCTAALSGCCSINGLRAERTQATT